MNLAARQLELTKAGFRHLPTRGTSHLGDDLVRGKNGSPVLASMPDVKPKINEQIVDMVLLGVELPKVYRHEDADTGKYVILKNGEVVETILAVLLDKEACGDYQLMTRFAHANMQFVTFDPSIPRVFAVSLCHEEF